MQAIFVYGPRKEAKNLCIFYVILVLLADVLIDKDYTLLKIIL